MDIEELKQLTNRRENLVWINTGLYSGSITADMFEAEGFKVNRFSRFDQSVIQQFLSCEKHANPDQKMPDEQRDKTMFYFVREKYHDIYRITEEQYDIYRITEEQYKTIKSNNIDLDLSFELINPLTGNSEHFNAKTNQWETVPMDEYENVDLLLKK